MKNRNIKNKLCLIVSVLILILIIGSCENYLDKAPAAAITEKDAFGNFVSFQGFIEELYNCVADYQKASGNKYDFMYADECLNSGYIFPFDKGNYWENYLLPGSSANTDNDAGTKRVFPLSWYGIRKANLGLSKLGLFSGTQEEKDLIQGQALFFRAWLHFELMRYYGGIPYIDTVLSSSGDIRIPRLNYRQTALKAAKDFRAAADLLPVKWDNTVAGQTTLGNNQQRITKIHALAFLGKDLLYAASPLMNEESTGSPTFDKELCKEAAQAFADVIKICNDTKAYQLQSWATWTDNFWVWSPGDRTLPGGTEVIMFPPAYDPGRVKWRMFSTPIAMGGTNGVVETPTHNFIKNFGMANGLPIDDPLSGYNENDPWVGRDPRFYKDIIVDGDKMVISNSAGVDQYAQLYNGGKHRGGNNGSPTGYYYKTFSPIGYNNWDKPGMNGFQTYPNFLRLADIYLMYAEAVLQGYESAKASVPGSGLTAEAAVNIIRNRATVPDVDQKFTGTVPDFMEVIIRERAMELAFESNHRWHDLRRWLIADQKKYLDKTAIDFDRGPNGKPINLKERVVITRVFEKKHYWYPFPVKSTMLYPGFGQNPGW